MFSDELVLEPDTRDYLFSAREALIGENPIFIDIGANKGDFTWLALSIHTTGTVHTFEPVPEIYNHLTTRFKDDNRVKLYNFGFFNEDKDNIDFYYLKNNQKDINASGMSSLYYRKDVFPQYENEKISVKVIKLDNMIDEIPKVNYIKIDTEGGEFDVLTGGINFIKQKTPEFIQWEYGGCFIDSNKTGKQVTEFLNELGYEMINPYFQHITPAIFPENYLCYNFLGIRKDIFQNGKIK